MENPYSAALVELNALVSEGKVLSNNLAAAKRLKGQVDIGAEITKLLDLAKPRTIERVGRGIKAIASAGEAVEAATIAFWYGKVYRVISSLHTGKRQCELSKAGKARFLRDLFKAGQHKSAGTIVTKCLGSVNKIVASVAVLESSWKPKGRLIAAGRLIQGSEEIEELLSKNASSYVKLCDPHCSPRTLKILEATKVGMPISILTIHIHETSKFLELLAEMRKHGLRISVVVKLGKPSFHDRFIVTYGKGWTIGTSLKDIGNRDTLIHEIDNRFQVEAMIDEYSRGARGQVREL